MQGGGVRTPCCWRLQQLWEWKAGPPGLTGLTGRECPLFVSSVAWSLVHLPPKEGGRLQRGAVAPGTLVSNLQKGHYCLQVDSWGKMASQQPGPSSETSFWLIDRGFTEVKSAGETGREPIFGPVYLKSGISCYTQNLTLRWRSDTTGDRQSDFVTQFRDSIQFSDFETDNLRLAHGTQYF